MEDLTKLVPVEIAVDQQTADVATPGLDQRKFLLSATKVIVGTAVTGNVLLTEERWPNEAPSLIELDVEPPETLCDL